MFEAKEVRAKEERRSYQGDRRQRQEFVMEDRRNDFNKCRRSGYDRRK